jgi:hypothetical protein
MVRRDAEHAGDEPSAAGGVDDEVGLSSGQRRRRREGVRSQADLRPVPCSRAFHACVRDHSSDSAGHGLSGQGTLIPKLIGRLTVVLVPGRDRPSDAMDG